MMELRRFCKVLVIACFACSADAARADSVVLTLEGHKVEANGAKAIVSDLKISAVSPDGAACDEIGDENGLLRCEVPCKSSSSLTKLVLLSPGRRENYSVDPVKPLARLRGCAVEPSRISIVYTHFRRLSQLAQLKLDYIIQANAPLKKIDVNGSTKSTEVAEIILGLLKDHSFDRSVGEDVMKFTSVTADISAYEWSLGNEMVAAQYAAYSTAASNAMIADVAQFYGKENQIRKSGLFSDYFKNVESISDIAKKYETHIRIPIQLREKTQDFFESETTRKSLDFEARKDLGAVWQAHRGLER